VTWADAENKTWAQMADGAPNIRVLVWGSGPRAIAQANAWAQVPGTEIVGLCDPLPGNALAAVRQLPERDIKPYDRPFDALQELSPDVLLIAARTPLHAPLTMLALCLGKPQAIVVEKPVARRLREAEMIRAMAGTTRLYACHQWSASPSMRRAREVVSDMGALESIEIEGKGYHGGYELVAMGGHYLNCIWALGIGSAITDIEVSAIGEPREGPYFSGPIVGEDLSIDFKLDGVPVEVKFDRLQHPNNTHMGITVRGSKGELLLYRDWAARLNGEVLDAEETLHGWTYEDHPASDLWLADSVVRDFREGFMNDNPCGYAYALPTLRLIEAAFEDAFIRTDLYASDCGLRYHEWITRPWERSQDKARWLPKADVMRVVRARADLAWLPQAVEAARSVQAALGSELAGIGLLTQHSQQVLDSLSVTQEAMFDSKLARGRHDAASAVKVRQAVGRQSSRSIE
jgi:predicted dehydrogenase